MGESGGAIYHVSMGEDLEAILFGFAQAMFSGEPVSSTTPDFEAALAKLSENRTLKAQSAMTWPIPAKTALRELLICWIFVIRQSIERGDPSPVPQDWISGSSSTRLNEKLVAEILNGSDALISLSQRRRQALEDRGRMH